MISGCYVRRLEDRRRSLLSWLCHLEEPTARVSDMFEKRAKAVQYENIATFIASAQGLEYCTASRTMPTCYMRVVTM